MIYITSLALTLLLVGLFTSKEIIEAGQLLFFFCALKCLHDNYKQKTLTLPKSAYWLLAFILIALIGIFINDDVIPRASINRNKLKYPLYGVLGIYVFRYWLKEASGLIKRWVLNIFLASVVVSAVYGIAIFFIEDQRRLNGLVYISRQAYGSSFFLILLFTLLLNREQFKNFFNPHLAKITFVLAFVAMTLTFSRAPMFSFLCAIPVSLFFYRRKFAYLFGAVSLVFTLSAATYYFIGNENTDVRFLITKNNGSDTKRRSVWQAAIIAIKERPILGWGYFNFKKQVERIKIQYDLPEKKFIEATSHNNFLEVTAGTGVLGLIPFLGWLFFWARETFSSYWGRAFIVPFGVIFFITSMVEVTVIDSHLSTLIYLVYSLSSSCNHITYVKPSKSTSSSIS